MYVPSPLPLPLLPARCRQDYPPQHSGRPHSAGQRENHDELQEDEQEDEEEAQLRAAGGHLLPQPDVEGDAESKSETRGWQCVELSLLGLLAIGWCRDTLTPLGLDQMLGSSCGVNVAVGSSYGVNVAVGSSYGVNVARCLSPAVLSSHQIALRTILQRETPEGTYCCMYIHTCIYMYYSTYIR